MRRPVSTSTKHPRATGTPLPADNPTLVAAMKIRSVVEAASRKPRSTALAVVSTDAMPVLTGGGFKSPDPAIAAEEFRSICRLMQSEVDRAGLLAPGRAPEEVYIHFRRGHHLVMTVAEVAVIISAMLVIADELDKMIVRFHPTPAEG